MTRPPLTRTGRNAAVFGASTLAAALLMLYPTSTNKSGHSRPGHVAAPVGVVQPVAGAAASAQPGPQTPTTTLVNGTSVDTPYGPVQVQLTVRGRHIIAATAIDYPRNSDRDTEINSVAIPQLQKETVTAQSVHIDAVSGATYTSDGYLQSLQAALDAAHLA